MQKSPRMVPGLESAGLVSPSITRPVFTTFRPSQTLTVGKKKYISSAIRTTENIYLYLIAHTDIANTVFQQHKIQFYIWTSPDGQYHNQILCSQRWSNSIQSAKTRLELTVAQAMSSLLQNSSLN